MKEAQFKIEFVHTFNKIYFVTSVKYFYPGKNEEVNEIKCSQINYFCSRPQKRFYHICLRAKEDALNCFSK